MWGGHSCPPPLPPLILLLFLKLFRIRKSRATAADRSVRSTLGRVPLAPPSPTLRDQHMVVHGYNTPCICAPYWAYAVRVGVEPSNAALALPDRHCPAVGLCSPLVAPTTYSS